MVGGTGFYLNFFIRGKPETPMSTDETEEKAWAHLRVLWATAEAEKGEPLSDGEKWDIATTAVRDLGDPATAERLKKPEFRNNFVRLVRAVDILLQSGGKPLADFIKVAWTPSDKPSKEEDGEGKKNSGEDKEEEEHQAKRARTEDTGEATTSKPVHAERSYRNKIYQNDAGLDYDFRCFYLCRDRVELYRRIDKRSGDCFDFPFAL